MTAIERCQIAVIGSGFGGSILARILATIGYSVVLIERGAHPRFAIGESSTPLANLTLERLAARYGLPDLHDLAAHGRWIKAYPELRRGLKRGFTFYRHHPHREFQNDAANSARLLVAASPDDEIADTHWLRADFDQHCVVQAAAAGVDYRDQVELTSAEPHSDGVRLRGLRGGDPVDLQASWVIDASGPAGFLPRQLGLRSGLDRTVTRSTLVFSHFADVPRFADVTTTSLPPGPYPDDRAAVHHLIDEGWMYSLRFDHDVVSAGFLFTPAGLESLGGLGDGNAQALFDRVLDRYPTIAKLFGPARPLFPIRLQSRIQHRWIDPIGERWIMLPHTYAFVDPLFSTGIAWTLLAVERLALAFEASGRPAEDRQPGRSYLERYAALLPAEADRIDQLVAGAYAARSDFELFAAHAMLYFATVSYGEVRQRLRGDESWAWQGFLGLDDPILEPLLSGALERLRVLTAEGTRPAPEELRARFVDWVTAAIEPRNIGGLADPARRNLYPVDLDLLIERAHLLGMKREEVVALLPRLRGSPSPLQAGAGTGSDSDSAARFRLRSSHLATGPTIASERIAGDAAKATGNGA